VVSAPVAIPAVAAKTCANLEKSPDKHRQALIHCGHVPAQHVPHGGLAAALADRRRFFRRQWPLQGLQRLAEAGRRAAQQRIPICSWYVSTLPAIDIELSL
jgi:hypothetical protein